MTDRSDQIDSILCAAVELKTADERARYVTEACGNNLALIRRVESLLTAHFAAGDFLERSPAGLLHRDDGEIVEGPGSLVGSYKLLQQIGEGGMGVVFMAEQTAPIHRIVALKVIKPGMDTRRVVARFEAERQALAMMDHPNIAKVLDAGTSASGRPYFVMDLVRGIPITEYCDSQRLPVRDRLALFTAVCHGVQHAHQKGIIHRDLKPTNVLVAEYDGRPVPRIIDFGVAKAIGQRLAEKTLFTHFGQIVGTLEYMSPEQARFNQLDVDTRSDIFSLGVLLYELLAGSTPLDRERLRAAALDEVLHMISEEEPPRPSVRLSSSDSLPAIAAHRGLEPRKLTGIVRGDLDWIVMKALEKERNRRYETASAFAQDIEHYLADEPIVARPPSIGYRLLKSARRHRVAFSVAALLVLFMIASLAVVTWMWARERVAREQAVTAESRATAAAELSARAVKLLSDLLAGVSPSTAEESMLLQDVLSTAAPHQSAAQALNNLGLALRERGRFADAEALHRRSLAILNEINSDDHDFAVYALNNLALALYDQGKIEQAEQAFQKAMQLGPPRWGTDDWQSATLYNNVGFMMLLQGRMDEAERMLNDALTIRQRHLGNNDVNTCETLFHLAELEFRRDRLKEAETQYRELLEILRQNPAAEKRHLSAVLMRLATLLVRMEACVEAEGLARESVAICQHIHPDYWGAFSTHSVLGASLLGQGKTDEAEKWLLDGYNGMVERWSLIPAGDRELVSDAAERLVQYYRTVGQLVPLKKWQSRFAQLKEAATPPYAEPQQLPVDE